MYNHVESKIQPIEIDSINRRKGNKLNDLEATLLCFQKLIDQKIEEGKKGVILFKNEESEYKMSYEKLKGLLWEIDSYFATKGAFSFGICENCVRFKNSAYSNGTYGKCGDNEKHMFDSCEDHEGDGGFGKSY